MNPEATTLSHASAPARAETDRRAVFLVFAALAAWAALSAGAALSGAIARIPPLSVPLFIWTPVLAGVLAYRRSAAVRAALDGIDLRLPILLHTGRLFFGIAFLVLLSRGELPAAFALPAGYGDILAGGLAPVAALAAGSRWGRRRLVVRAWNTLALVDILLVFLTAQRLILFEGDVEFFRTMLTRFPFGMLPTFVVPLVIVTHLLIFARTRRPVEGETRRNYAAPRG